MFVIGKVTTEISMLFMGIVSKAVILTVQEHFHNLCSFTGGLHAVCQYCGAFSGRHEFPGSPPV
jgi:hypothetical protein